MALKLKTIDIVLIVIIIVMCILVVKSNTCQKIISEYFDTDIPTYLVSMEKDHERRKLLYIYVTPHEYSSVDGSKLTTKDQLQQNNVLASSNTNLTNGEIGCYLSHYNIFNKIKNYKHQYSMILEDDVHLDIQKTQQQIQEIAKNAPSDWEVLFLGHNHYEEEVDEKKIM